MENLNMNSNYKPEKKKVVDENGKVKKERKLFADPKYNKLLIAVGIVVTLIIIAGIVFVCLPTETFVH